MSIILPEMFDMNYDKLVKYFLKKNGHAKYDYFHTPECKSVNKKNTRTSEGLELHHIDENKHPELNDPVFALHSPFECQKAKRLVYVNILEHLLLHIKIYEEKCWLNKATGKNIETTTPGIIRLSHIANDYFSGNYSAGDWRENMAKVIINDYDDFIAELYYYLQIVSKYFPNDNSTLHSALTTVSQHYNSNIYKNTFYALTSKFPEYTFAEPKKPVLKKLNPPSNDITFEIGEYVDHPSFGKGKVLSLANPFIEVDFEEYGVKKLALGFAKLKKISE